mmetsp:Transcript_29504/g.42206  ORF Transcript_29504/g.42206 Transcript_29504/m.42206 type:complete len:291 (-) Transcript_29504:185-1057(-)|eukprot:CAMPEP_0172428336 /NCGR_PEP_ID=MMETSP1064-20121228/45939_1 /TAXON_ID=202472 /ORGANISM="Aulacoseira subarctica , Strain CCAP 1002/5" /LENGTH=290 /DNA_ID=CAMNT_0013173061 /DNA_START=566 /DNA_END=1438 /DNA_ORIENTATION=-
MNHRIKELTNQPYDCMLEVEDDSDVDTIHTTEGNVLFNNIDGEYDGVPEEQLSIDSCDYEARRNDFGLSKTGASYTRKHSDQKDIYSPQGELSSATINSKLLEKKYPISSAAEQGSIEVSNKIGNDIALNSTDYTGVTGARNVTVQSLEGNASLPSTKLQIDTWINSIQELHRSKPPEQVTYKKPMPPIEELLLSPWPQDFVSSLRNETIVFPNVDLDLSLEEYGALLCSIIDIPVYKGSLIESIHLMFSLFIQFRANSAHFSPPGRGGSASLPSSRFIRSQGSCLSSTF